MGKLERVRREPEHYLSGDPRRTRLLEAPALLQLSSGGRARVLLKLSELRGRVLAEFRQRASRDSGAQGIDGGDQGKSLGESARNASFLGNSRNRSVSSESSGEFSAGNARIDQGDDLNPSFTGNSTRVGPDFDEFQEICEQNSTWEIFGGDCDNASKIKGFVSGSESCLDGICFSKRVVAPDSSIKDASLEPSDEEMTDADACRPSKKKKIRGSNRILRDDDEVLPLNTNDCKNGLSDYLSLLESNYRQSIIEGRLAGHIIAVENTDGSEVNFLLVKDRIPAISHRSAPIDLCKRLASSSPRINLGLRTRGWKTWTREDFLEDISLETFDDADIQETKEPVVEMKRHSDLKADQSLDLQELEDITSSLQTWSLQPFSRQDIAHLASNESTHLDEMSQYIYPIPDSVLAKLEQLRISFQ